MQFSSVNRANRKHFGKSYIVPSVGGPETNGRIEDGFLFVGQWKPYINYCQDNYLYHLWIFSWSKALLGALKNICQRTSPVSAGYLTKFALKH